MVCYLDFTDLCRFSLFAVCVFISSFRFHTMASRVLWSEDALQKLAAVASAQYFGDEGSRARLVERLGESLDLQGSRVDEETGKLVSFSVARTPAQLMDQMHWPRGREDRVSLLVRAAGRLRRREHYFALACLSARFCPAPLLQRVVAYLESAPGDEDVDADPELSLGLRRLRPAFVAGTQQAEFVDEVWSDSFRARGRDQSGVNRRRAFEMVGDVLGSVLPAMEGPLAEARAGQGDGRAEAVSFWHRLCNTMPPLRAKNSMVSSLQYYAAA